MKIKTIKKEGKFLNYFSSISGLSGIFSSYQVCHNICLTVIVLLSLIGITLTGMPLLFLQKVALPLWTLALILLAIALFLYMKFKHCISKNLIMFNVGAITFGVPFESLQKFKIYFYILGGAIMIIAISLIIKNKWRKIKWKRKKK